MPMECRSFKSVEEETMGKKTVVLGVMAVAGLAVVLALGVASVAWAGDAPSSLSGATTVAADRVKQMMDKGTPVFDVRVANEYAEAHVKGAKSVPYKEKSAKAADFDGSQDSFDLAKLPSDKSAPVVFYCNGPECWKSYKASKTAVQAGYRQVFWFRGGMPEWKHQGFPVE
jgi:rhodanese-related sulfurtransferase